MTDPTAITAVTIEAIVEATPGDGMTLAELETKLIDLGHNIVSVNPDRNSITVLNQTETSHLIVRPNKEN